VFEPLTPSITSSRSAAVKIRRPFKDGRHCRGPINHADCATEASSGKVTRHRLDRGGNRQANSALHRIVLVRLRWTPSGHDGLRGKEDDRGKVQAGDRQVFEALRRSRGLRGAH
jgi:Transposase IS116/IS110/IS902 family